MCHAFYKDYEKACVHFKELLRLQPEDVPIGTNYGRMLALSGEVDKAIEQLTRTLKMAEDKNEETLIEQVRFFFSASIDKKDFFFLSVMRKREELKKGLYQPPVTTVTSSPCTDWSPSQPSFRMSRKASRKELKGERCVTS